MLIGSVGSGGQNRRQDVLLVQELLNKSIDRLAPIRPLSVDGLAGPKTIQAITEFQRRIVLMSRPDGRVDVSGKTINALQSPVASSNPASSELTFISETGMFHAACRLKSGSGVQWYGFKPKEHLSPKGPGFVDTSDRSAFINHAVMFDVNSAVLRKAIAKVATDYASKTYIVTVCHCVSFVADVARQCGLQVPTVNILPYNFIQALAVSNKYTSKT